MKTLIKFLTKKLTETVKTPIDKLRHWIADKAEEYIYVSKVVVFAVCLYMAAVTLLLLF